MEKPKTRGQGSALTHFAYALVWLLGIRAILFALLVPAAVLDGDAALDWGVWWFFASFPAIAFAGYTATNAVENRHENAGLWAVLAAIAVSFLPFAAVNLWLFGPYGTWYVGLIMLLLRGGGDIACGAVGAFIARAGRTNRAH